jgi:hypothetical protein
LSHQIVIAYFGNFSAPESRDSLLKLALSDYYLGALFPIEP